MDCDDKLEVGLTIGSKLIKYVTSIHALDSENFLCSSLCRPV